MADDKIKTDESIVEGAKGDGNASPVALTPEEDAKLQLFKSWVDAGKNAKKPIEWEWFVRKNYLDGNHWVRFNQVTQTIEQVSTGNKYQVTINEIYRITRAIRAYVTKHQPKWEVIATNTTDKVYIKSEASERLLDTYYTEEHIKMKLKNIVYDGLYASVGHIWFWWDAEKRWLCSIGVDPFDFIPDPTAEDIFEYSDAQFVARAFKTKVNALKTDKRYQHTDLVVADNLLAASDMKVALMQLTASAQPNSWTDQKDLETVIGIDMYYRDSEWNVRHCVFTSTSLLVDESTRFMSIPARTYHTDTETGKQYTQGWVKNLIGPQKMINQLESNTLEWNHIMAKGRYVADKRSGVTSVINKNGQIILKNTGTYFQQLATQSEPVTVENQITRAKRYVEDSGAAHDAFVGRMPTGANSGIAINTLQAGEENNLVDLRDNLDDFYISCGRLILQSFARYKQNIMVMFEDDNASNTKKMYAAVGNSSPIKMKETNVTYNGKVYKVPLSRILEENNVRVSVGTWLGTNKAGAQDTLLKMADAKIIDGQTVLEYFNAPNIPAIMSRVRSDAHMKAILDTAVKSAPGSVPAMDMGQGNAPMGQVPTAPPGATAPTAPPPGPVAPAQ